MTQCVPKQSARSHQAIHIDLQNCVALHAYNFKCAEAIHSKTMAYSSSQIEKHLDHSFARSEIDLFFRPEEPITIKNNNLCNTYH